MNTLLEMLCALREAVPVINKEAYGHRVFYGRVGICANVETALAKSDIEDSYVIKEQLKALILKWPDHYDPVAWPSLPVGGPREYDNKSGLWRNPRRIELLDWLIKELENEKAQ